VQRIARKNRERILYYQQRAEEAEQAVKEQKQCQFGQFTALQLELATNMLGLSVDEVSEATGLSPG
jgi:hypothetical protein